MLGPRILVVALSVGVAHRAAQAYDALNVGDLATELKVARWVKGDKIEKFDPGRIYVVEFWATWCGPCQESIPHLTELDHQYRSTGVTFIGVNVWEPDVKKVKPYVEKMGARMDYNIALDGVPPGVDEPNLLQSIFRRVINPENVESPDPRMIALALKAAKRAVALTKEKEPAHLDTLALAQYLNGNAAAALVSEEKQPKLSIQTPRTSTKHSKNVCNVIARRRMRKRRIRAAHQLVAGLRPFR